jgi:hypothetical protein
MPSAAVRVARFRTKSSGLEISKITLILWTSLLSVITGFEDLWEFPGSENLQYLATLAVVGLALSPFFRN